MCHRHVPGDQAAHRVADQGGASRADNVEEGDHAAAKSSIV
jgi:hypothetical protein